jgi:hypothetical protein
MLIVSSSLLAMAGCAANNEPQAVDLAAVRCPPPSASDARILAARPVAPPPGDLTVGGVRSLVDGLETQVHAKAAAGRRVINQYNRCRSGDRAGA